MKKLALMFLLSVGFSSISYAQDFSFDDLVRLRSSSFPSFETAAHDKGYKMAHLGYDYTCATFSKRGNAISYCETTTRGMHSHCLPSVRYETTSGKEYEKIKSQVQAGTKYLKTKMHVYSSQEYMDHIYSNDEVVVHMYDIAYRYDCDTHYVIEIYSIYSDR